MILFIDIEDDNWNQIPDLEDVARKAVAAALGDANVEVNILFTDDLAIAKLNKDWRGKASPTNVLSFPVDDFPVPAGEAKPLGDIVLAYGVVSREAAEQGKTLPQHAIHLMIHGALHLLGHDHEADADAQAMEALEIDILKGLGFPDPYERD